MNNKLINEEKIIVLSIIFLIEKNEEKSWNFWIRIRYFPLRIEGSGSVSK